MRESKKSLMLLAMGYAVALVSFLLLVSWLKNWLPKYGVNVLIVLIALTAIIMAVDLLSSSPSRRKGDA